MARQGITPNGREKLIIALQLTDIINEVNTALRARKARVTVDYTDVQPRLMVSMPGSEPAVWLVANPRTKRCFGFWPADPDLNALVHDVTDRLTKYNAWLALGCEKRHNEKPRCKLQVFLRESKYTAITLVSALKGQAQPRDQFLLPKALA